MFKVKAEREGVSVYLEVGELSEIPGSVLKRGHGSGGKDHVNKGGD